MPTLETLVLTIVAEVVASLIVEFVIKPLARTKNNIK